MSPQSSAIVAEGGGQRGIYTAGVLDAFLQAGFNPFALGLGVSAGAQNLFAYFLNQPGYARRAIEELTAAADFFVPYRWLADRNVVDLDGYFERSQNDPEYRLPYQRISQVQLQRRLLCVATDSETLEPLYLEPDESNIVEYLKASSAVPLLYKTGVSFAGRKLIDGGVSDPIPIRQAYDQGARRIVLIRTSASGHGQGWRQRLEQFRKLRALPPSMMRMLESTEAAELESEHFIENCPADLELIEIAPESPLRSQVFGSRSDDLLIDYKVGWFDGMQAMQSLADWQNLSTTAQIETA